MNENWITRLFKAIITEIVGLFQWLSSDDIDRRGP
jgi:hypothetical protein